ncbi:Something about silencing, SAS, complex subunit 4-domain-containing protein [Madurella fahalii]|uniref:Something about silencing, SAS, complex subunit 4-domain-containing protein n=1 Tax=Madurella fahalii TaxID=1157608 RepID=A0ABQ0FZG0_9PEZI
MAMTTSVTRSRRAEGLHLSHSKIPNGHHHRLIANTTAKPTQNNQQFPVNPPRAKRPLEAPGRDCDPIVPKRARFTTGIAVEIPARPSFHARFTSREPADARSPQAPPPKPTIAGRPKSPSHSRATPPAANAAANATLPSAQQQPALTRHQEKVANGLKHELDRLQPSAADTKDQGRKLRSQEATRFKSELSAYFPDYDEVIGNDPKEHHILNLDTPIVVVNSKSDAAPPNSDSQPHPPRRETYPVRSYSDALFTDLFDAQRVDPIVPFLNERKSLEDPLPDSLFEPAHKKAERLERSIRNSEKGRAQHEKDQIIRLLDGLQGHDWLRVMGVSGITESRKKQFEPAREHFIKGCQAILEKFRRWAAEEKRRKQEKDRAAAEAGRQAEREAAASEEKDLESGEADEGSVGEDEEIADSDADMEDGDGEPDGEPPDDSDVDATIAKQLREEALAAAKKTTSRRGQGQGRGRGRGRRTPPPRKSPPVKTAPEPTKEFTSFFAKRYQRDAALNTNRRRGRKVMAWGHPVPDVEEADWELPAEYRNEDALKSRARRRRRDKRGRH